MIAIGHRLVRERWFAKQMRICDPFVITKYKQYAGIKACPLMIRTKFQTLVIDLRRSSEAIIKAFSQTTRYEIRRASKEGVSFGAEVDRGRFLEFYNHFAGKKGLRPIRSLSKYGNHLNVTEAIYAGSTLCMHAYLVDPDEGIARLLHSASLLSGTEDQEVKKLIGMANRFLHYEDMKAFRDAGFGEYDLGGYAGNTKDPLLESINQFKDGFRGVLKESEDCKSPLYFAIEFCLTRLS